MLEKKDTIIETCKQLMLNELTEPTWIGHLILINGYIALIFGRNNSLAGRSAMSRDRSPLGITALLYSTHKGNFRESRRISVRRNEFDSEFLLEFLPCYGKRKLQVVAATTRTDEDFVTIQFLNS